MLSKKQRKKVIYGNYETYPFDEYYIIREGGELLVVNEHYFDQESAIVFTIGHPNTDWSANMLLEAAKKAVDLLNKQSKEQEEFRSMYEAAKKYQDGVDRLKQQVDKSWDGLKETNEMIRQHNKELDEAFKRLK